MSGGPLLLPGLRPVWRGQDSLQLGRDPERNLVLRGVDTATARLVIGLDGTRSESDVLAEATAAGMDAGRIADMLAGLRSRGYVVDGEPDALSSLGGPDTVERLTPDCLALSLAHPDRRPISVMRRRRQRLVALHDAGRLGAPVVALLAAAGIGRVAVVDREKARPCDVNPAGVAAADTFLLREEAVRRAVLRAAPEAEVGALPPGERPDLTVLAGFEPVDTRLREALHDLEVPHLALTIRESAAIVGPLVVPGHTPCLTCADLYRRDRDPAWTAIVSQLLTPRRRQREPADVVLATFAASLAAMQILDFLDGGRPGTIGGTLEVRPPSPAVVHRNWPAHGACGCGAAERISATRRTQQARESGGSNGKDADIAGIPADAAATGQATADDGVGEVTGAVVERLAG